MPDNRKVSIGERNDSLYQIAKDESLSLNLDEDLFKKVIIEISQCYAFKNVQMIVTTDTKTKNEKLDDKVQFNELLSKRYDKYISMIDSLMKVLYLR